MCAAEVLIDGDKLESIFLIASDSYKSITSSLVRQIIDLKGVIKATNDPEYLLLIITSSIFVNNVKINIFQ